MIKRRMSPAVQGSRVNHGTRCHRCFDALLVKLNPRERDDITGLFDARDVAALASVGFAPEDLGDPAWRLRMNRGERVPTQDLAETLVGQGHCGMVVRSFAKGARADSANVVLWSWGQGTAASLELVDDDGRLG